MLEIKNCCKSFGNQTVDLIEAFAPKYRRLAGYGEIGADSEKY